MTNGASARAPKKDGARVTIPATVGQSLLESLPEAVVVVNANGDIEFVNAETERLFGYQRTEIIGRTVGEVMTVGLAPLSPGGGVEIYGRCKDGSRFPVAISLSPVQTQEGVLFAAVVRAVAARNDAEEALRKSEDRYKELVESAAPASGPERLDVIAAERKRAEEKFRVLLESVPDGMVIVNVQGNITMANTRMEQMFGYAESDLVGRPAELLLAEGDIRKHPFKARVPRSLRSGPVPAGIEMCGLRKDGTEFPIQVNATSIETDEGALVSTTIRDITERKRIEEELRLGAERVAAIVDLSYDAFVSMDRDGLVTAWNPQAEATFGWTKEESLGQPLVERIVPERYRDSHLGGLSHVLTTANDRVLHRHFEMLAMHKDGHEFPIEITISSVEAGSRYKFNAFIQDITARGYAEAELQLVHGELERRVRERTKEVTKSNALLRREISERQDVEQALAERAEELARSNSELEQFAYVTSHDLKEPLRMVTSYLQLLERRYKDSLDVDATDFIEFAVDGALRMRGLIDGLLAYSRVGTHGEPFGPTDVNESVRHAIANLETAISESGATVTADKLPTVTADGTQLVQLFQNLIGNAIKFHDGQPPTVHVGVKSKRDHWLFWVRDNGIGISPQYSERIFVIFQRLHARDEYPGTGIGLAICRKIVERHGGQIWVKSRPGRGATFYFTIPNRAKLHSRRDVKHG